MRTMHIARTLAVIIGAFLFSCAQTTNARIDEKNTKTADDITATTTVTGHAPKGEVKVKKDLGRTEGDGYAEDRRRDRPGDKEAVAKASLGGSTRPAEISRTSPSTSVPSASGLKAGYADDNKQFNYFIGFLEKYKHVRHFDIPVQERHILSIKDVNGRSIPNAQVTVSDAAGTSLVSGTTYADGTFLFFPAKYGNAAAYKAVAVKGQQKGEASFTRTGKRDITLAFDSKRVLPANTPLDIVFIFDTTGSMGEEIQRLKDTIEIIKMNIASMPSKPRVRFGMVLYRDRGDDYVTKTVPLTADLTAFQKELATVSADGGGDTPEDLQSALKDAVNGLAWNTDGVRLAFIITDAEAHLDYNDEYTYGRAAADAAKKGIKIYSVGTGGLPIEGEYILRQISQYTYAKYIFLTYGERGESDGGREQSVSHHTGANFVTDKLETIIMGFAREELSHLADDPRAFSDEHFTAVKGGEKNEETLMKLFDMALSQLIDYSSLALGDRKSVSCLPFSAERSFAADAEYFAEQLNLVVSRNKTFTLVERKDMQKIMKELELTLTGLTDEKNAAKIGKVIGAEYLIIGQCYTGKDYEIFLKLVRVGTSEILSVTKVKIDRKLGLGK
ncbi:MAG: VWA domain-containing protein [Spirochaetota bacterium]